MLCAAGANGSHQEQQPVSVSKHDTEYLDGKKPVRAVDGLTERNNFKSFLSFRRYSQPYVHQQKTVPRCHRHQPEVTSFPEIWTGCLALNVDKVFVCLL